MGLKETDGTKEGIWRTKIINLIYGCVGFGRVHRQNGRRHR